MILVGKSLFLGPAALPAVPPVLYEERKADGVHPKSRLEAYAEVAIRHLVLLGVSSEETQMTGDSEEQVVVPRWEGRELVFQKLRHFTFALARRGDSVLRILGKNLAG